MEIRNFKREKVTPMAETITPTPKPTATGSGAASIVFIVIVLLLLGGVVYYFYPKLNAQRLSGIEGGDGEDTDGLTPEVAKGKPAVSDKIRNAVSLRESADIKQRPGAENSGKIGEGKPAMGSNEGKLGITERYINAVVNKKTLGSLSNYSDLTTQGVKWENLPPAQQQAYGAFHNKIASLFGTNKDSSGLDWIAVYAQGFFKGFNIAQTPTNVELLKPEIQEYLNSPYKLAHWEHTIPGRYLTSTLKDVYDSTKQGKRN